MSSLSNSLVHIPPSRTRGMLHIQLHDIIDCAHIHDAGACGHREGKLVPQTDPRTIADGLLTSMGDMTWPIIRDHVEEVRIDA